jgi:large subunit ribosomal protein L31e
MVREFAIKNMKSDEVKIDQDLGRHIWARGKTNPPRKVRVKMVKDEDDIVTVSLYEEAIETEEDEEEKEDTKKAKGSSKKGTEDDSEEEGKDDESEEAEDKK